jgi:hypothetical protein
MSANRITRSLLWSALLLAPVSAAHAAPVHHEFDRLAAPIKGMLIQASDRALDKLARPGAFSMDDAIRIILPGQPDEASQLVEMAGKAGMTARLQDAINDAAGLAAGQAKPIFRRAIQRMTLKDTIQVLSKDHGATNYLRKSSGGELYAMLRPIIANALDRTGAYKLAKLQASGALADLAHNGRTAGHGPAAGAAPDSGDDPLWDPDGAAAPTSREALADNVTDQAMRGIFKYIAHQEEKIRRDPSDLAFKLIDKLDR